MKRTKWLLLSLTLNVGLLVAIILQTHLPSPTTPKTQGANPISTAGPLAAADAPTPARAVATDNPASGDWQQLIGQLRSAGVPESALSELVVAHFEGQWQKQAHDMERRFNRGEVDQYTLARQAEEHDTALETQMKTLLGPDAFLKWDKEKILQCYEDINLSSDEADAVYQLRKQLTQAQHDLQLKNMDGSIDQAELETQQTAAEKDYDTKMEALVGETRFAQLQTPSDGDAAQLAHSLASLNTSAAELQTLLQAQQQFTQSRAALQQQAQGTNGTFDNQLQALDMQRDAEFQKILGPDVFTQLQMLQDTHYQQLDHYKSAWNLSSDDVSYVYSTLQSSDKSIADYEQQAKDLAAQGQSVDWQAVNQNIQQYQNQTQQSLQQYLGDDRFGKLKHNSVFNTQSVDSQPAGATVN